MDDGGRDVTSSNVYCGVENCSNSTEKTPNLTFVTLPCNRKGHKKWFELTFGDTEISSNCQVVCEAHMEPHFASLLKERHLLHRSEPAEIENDVSGILSSGPSNLTNRPRKRKRRKKLLFYRKKIRKPTAKTSKNRAEIKKTIDQKQYDALPVPVPDPIDEQYDALPLPVPDPLDKPLPEDCKDEMLDETPPEKDSLEETALNEPPEKRVRLEIPPLRQTVICKRPKELFYRKKIRKPIAKISKNRAEIKKTIDPKQYDALPVPVPDPLDKQHDALPVPVPDPLDKQYDALPVPVADPLDKQYDALPVPVPDQIDKQYDALPLPVPDPLDKQYDALPVPVPDPLDKPLPEDRKDNMLEETPPEKDSLEETALNQPPEKRVRLEIPPIRQTVICKRPKKLFYRKKIRKPTAKISKNQAAIKKTIDPKQYDAHPVPVPDPLDKQYEALPVPVPDPLDKQYEALPLPIPDPLDKQYEALPVPVPDPLNKPLPEDRKDDMLEETPPEKDSLEETALNEPPEKRVRLEIPPIQQTDINSTDSITYEIIIKDDPDNFEREVLPSVICDDIDVEIKREDPDNKEVMDEAYYTEQAYRAVIDVKIESTDNVLEKQVENIFSECKIVPPSLKVVKVKSQTTDLPAPRAFMTFTKLLDSVLEENLISSDQRDMLAQFKVDSKFFMDFTQLLNPKPKMKSFAIALYLMSHRAYDYILRTYKTSLPPLTAVKDWLVQQKGHSGFTRETLEVLNFMTKNREGKKIKKSPTYICLVLKTIMLHNYNRAPSNRLTVVGNTTNPLEWSLATAESVLVLTAVAINAGWKLPIGYFWDNVVKDSELANLVKVAIDVLETVGAVPVAISFESNDNNRRMCEDLSGNLTPTVKEYFMSNSGIPIFMFPDPCDIIEQIDKDIKDIECFDNSRRVVSLKHLPKLIKYANIPSGQITLKKAIASQLCRKDFRSYKGAGAGTLTFLEHLQNVFEILSSRHSVRFRKLMEARPTTGAIPEEIHRHAVMLRQAEIYIKSLKLKDSTEPLGLALDNFGSLRSFCTLIMTTLIMICKYWSIPFGKFIGNSTFFLSNLMPQCNGNRRPTANTFQRKYKAMLEENISKPLLHRSTEKNIHNFSVLKCKNPVDIINLTTVISNGNKLRIFAHDFWKLLRCETDEFTDEFVVYVSKYVTTILVCELHCETCISALRSLDANISKKQKNRPKPEKANKKLVVTRLEEPSSDVMDICEKSEEVFKTAVFHRDRGMNVKLCVPLLVSKVLRKYMDRPLFEDLRHHQFDTDPTCNHLIELTRAVASCYLDLRISNWNRNVELTKEKELLQKKV